MAFSRQQLLNMVGPHCRKQILESAPPKKQLNSDADGEYAGMNRWEREYVTQLFLLKRSGAIEFYAYESVKLCLAKRTWYTPDFMLVRSGCVEFHEVKGFMRDDAAVKLKVAADMHRWAKFVLVQREHGEWKFTPVVPRVAV